ncbi:MAG: dipeptidase PepE, partial [Candidatus Rokuibacteriota bacterium]
HWERTPLKTLERVDGVFVGGGNTYALLDRVRAAGLIEAIQERARSGMPYAGASAGANLAGPTILTTNDWNVVALARFDALGLVPFNVNPHYLEADPAMAPHSETRDDRIREYHVVNANPVFGVEEGTWLRVEDALAVVGGRGRVKVFARGVSPRWHHAGDRVSLQGS